jgi:hypothetical protein
MPRYSYTCPCGEQLELSVPIADRDNQHCGGQHDKCPRAREAGAFAEKLTREEIPLQGAPASYSWSKWQR